MGQNPLYYSVFQWCLIQINPTLVWLNFQQYTPDMN